MTKILILGATGSIARAATRLFLDETDTQLTLYVRDARGLGMIADDRVRVIEGDVLDVKTLTKAMVGQDVVYANLAGDLVRMARTIVAAMHESGARRLIFISSMGIYETPGRVMSAR